jgi:uncharacterized protein (DUF2141 family)
MNLLLWLWMAVWPGAGEIRLSISTTLPGQGKVHIAIFDDAASFDARQPMRFSKVAPTPRSGALLVSAPGLPARRYAVAVFQDLNGNGKLDTNTMGIPQEPYAFSRNPRAKWRAPDYDEASFLYEGGNTTQEIRLKSWGER